MLDADENETLAALLAWYREMGADEAVGETPIDWLVHGAAAPGAAVRERIVVPAAAAAPAAISAATPLAAPRPGSAQAASRPPPAGHQPSRPAPAVSREARSFPSAPPDVSQLAARTAATGAPSLAALEAALRSFDGCGLKATAKNLCFYRGAERARVMLIGEAPGRDEDLEGKPFVGPAGQLLDRMLASIGLTEADVHITNIVYWRPPGNRTPTPQEATVCRPFLDRQIALVAPEFVIPLGGAAAKHMLNAAEGIMRLRGRWQAGEFGGHPVRILATLHPAYLLRTPAAKRLAWRDLLSLKAEI
ncbi:MAG: uracil-DNA glycosylase family protein [Hyphomicrobiaceae bacterium]|nr:uracil-DNA glycosylase family protein [Hyphomicrobiaceae bacterium]